MRRYSAVAEFDIANLRPHRYGCRCGDDGRCEQASLALRGKAERREMAGSCDPEAGW